MLSYADGRGDVACAGILCTVCYVANVGKLVNTLETVHELVALSEGKETALFYQGRGQMGSFV